jgi:hypothetical protein
MNEMMQQSIVYTMKLFSKTRWRVQQKATQRLWIREAEQARKILEGPVSAQKGRSLDAIQP